MCPVAHSLQWGSQGGNRRRLPSLCSAGSGRLWTEAWVWGDEREPFLSPWPMENVPGLGVRVRLHLSVSRPLWAPGSHQSDDHWHPQSYGGGGVDLHEAVGAPGWRLCVTRRSWGCSPAGQGVPVWAQGVPATVKASPVHLGLELLESREQNPHMLREAMVLRAAKGPAQGFVAEKAQNCPMRPA